uniref:ribonuclease H n=1 Tax=Sipha flava TaxID=143950 RepID=A0A2S2QZ41_9HEMI
MIHRNKTQKKNNALEHKSIKQNNTFRVDKQISVTNSQNIDLLNQIKSLQCLFTWEVKSQRNQDMIIYIKNKYGNVNLDISLPEFTFTRFIGNLIISHELYLNGELNASDMKILEIDKWLDQLDKTTDEFYLSINIALKHIRAANFIHMLFDTNEITGFNMLLDEIVPFEIMDDKLKAVVHIIHAAILMEYGINQECYKYAQIACNLDPNTSHWWHIHACVLTKRQFLFRKKLSLNTKIIETVKRAVMTSDKINTSVDSFVLITLNEVVKNEFQISDFESINYSEYTNTNYADLSLKTIMETLVKRHKNGEDVLPDLNDLILKFKHDKWKIIVDICSYTVLFRNNFRFGIELFLMLIKEPNLPIKNYIKYHNSIFIDNSKIFNLAELIWIEIILTISNSRDISSEDILFYYKVFIEMKVIYNLKMRVFNPCMRVDLIGYKNKKLVIKNKNIIKDNIKSNFQMQVGLKKYCKSEESKNTVAADSQQSYNLSNEFQYLNTTFNYFGHYECLPSSSVIEYKINLFFQSIIELNSSTTSKIILTDIDTSLTVFPRSHTSPEIYKYNLQIILNKHPNGFRIYTDASRIQNNVGIAIVSIKNCYSYKLSSEYSSSEAEAVAILRALDYALTENMNEYIILSDSLSTIMCIQNKNINSDVINSILCLIHAHQLKQNVIHFVWIPSHKMIEGNDKADKLAKEIAVSSTAITYTHNSYVANNLPSN